MGRILYILNANRSLQLDDCNIRCAKNILNFFLFLSISSSGSDSGSPESLSFFSFLSYGNVETILILVL
ncbi:hypothetical protein H359_0538 [Chlamydia ibidis 10-1398/6]|uniref:Nef attachable domain protein n=1 Tax=Chlamydia ibidis 10-1398/6 TaxID=1046581 RepID=A0ABN0MZR0_9CHLA|nr:hypothetical protein H359_0538 [Chlamydia ibidis 10-1398/6]